MTSTVARHLSLLHRPHGLSALLEILAFMPFRGVLLIRYVSLFTGDSILVAGRKWLPHFGVLMSDGEQVPRLDSYASVVYHVTAY